MSHLYLLAGPNGSGKTTLYERAIRPHTGLPFVNADVIAHRLADRGAITDEMSAEAAQLAARHRDELIERGVSFVAETVFSHHSKLDLIRRAVASGYVIHLRVVVVPEDLSVMRVATRVRAGGHDVPEDRIRARHRRLWGLLAEAIPLVDDTVIYDNSNASTPFRTIAAFRHGVPIAGPLPWPTWAPSELHPDRFD